LSIGAMPTARGSPCPRCRDGEEGWLTSGHSHPGRRTTPRTGRRRASGKRTTRPKLASIKERAPLILDRLKAAYPGSEHRPDFETPTNFRRNDSPPSAPTRESTW
jgi:hypothetical protein